MVSATLSQPVAPPSMAQLQGAAPPPWLGRSRLSLLRDAIGGPRQNVDKVVQLAGLLVAPLRPPLVRERLERLRRLGHIDAVPNMFQLLVAGRDQMILSATAETKVFYQSQGIPWVFHNLRRFIAGPATMLDPIGLFSPRETIVHHVLQTFHRHPVYDMVLLRAHEGGIEALAEQAEQIRAGTHPHQRALVSLVEDGAYHPRLPEEIRAFIDDPHLVARSVPNHLVDDPMLMLAMEQFKDIGGFARYAARLEVGLRDAVVAWLCVVWNETVGELLNVKLGRQKVVVEACDPELVRTMMK